MGSLGLEFPVTTLVLGFSHLLSQFFILLVLYFSTDKRVKRSAIGKSQSTKGSAIIAETTLLAADTVALSNSLS